VQVATVFYWDVALLLNLVTLLPWLWATARLAGHPVRWWRLAVTSLLFSSLAVLWEAYNLQGHLLLALAGTGLLLEVAFGPLRPGSLIRTFFPFLMIGASAAGITLFGVAQTGATSLGVLVGIALASGGAQVVWSELMARARVKAEPWQVRLQVGEAVICLRALLDTGHQLRAPITGLPVLLVAPGDLVPLLGRSLCERILSGMDEWDQLPIPWRGRVSPVPYQTVAGGGVLPAFRPDDVWLQRAKGPWQRVQALVGITAFGVGGRGDYQVLLPPLLTESLREVERR
jgi:stage II sporulation protein GA (sporulation sigma-E factor processing peptidase)